MPRSLRAVNCARHNLPTASCNQHVWISDALLSETLHNFSHGHRRYGSNTPGPLEARRRATRRRNTNLAHVQHIPAIDPIDVFGPGPQNDWWRKTPPQKVSQSPRMLPSWLFGLPEHPDTPHPRTHAPENLPHSDRFPDKGDAGTVRLESTFRRQIKQCSKLKTIRNVVKNTELSLWQYPLLAEIAFRRMLELYWSNSTTGNAEVQEFLSDPGLNPPCSSNHLILIEELCKNTISRKTWDVHLFPTLQKSVQLGLIGVQELQQIILLLPDVHKVSGFATIRDGDKITSDYHRLISALEESKILSLRDLGQDFVHNWYKRIADSVPSDNVISLLWRLRRFSGQVDVDMIAQLVTSKLQYLVREGVSATDKFKAWIIGLPEDLRGLAILRTSQSLVASALKGGISTVEVDRWYQTFSTLNDTASTPLYIDKDSWHEALASPGSLTLGQNLLTLAWTITYISANQAKVSHLLSSFGFEQQFLETFSSTQHSVHDNLLGQVVMTLDTLPLPAKDRLYRHLQLCTDQDLMSVLGHRVFEDDLKSLADRDLTKLNDERFYRWAKQNTSDALGELSRSVTTDLVAFKMLAQNLIMKNKSTFKIVNRILEHNLAFKLALPFWPDHVELQKQEYGGQFHLDPAQVNDLIHQLAISFAVSPVIGPRSAFRYVYRLYLYLHRYGAPIYPLMARALWHAGVTRYGKDGTPNTQLRWCLFKVCAIEGQNVADMLLWSSGFRDLRGQELETSLFSTARKEPDLPLVLQNKQDKQKLYLKGAKQRVEPKKHVSEGSVRKTITSGL